MGEENFDRWTLMGQFEVFNTSGTSEIAGFLQRKIDSYPARVVGAAETSSQTTTLTVHAGTYRRWWSTTRNRCPTTSRIRSPKTTTSDVRGSRVKGTKLFFLRHRR
jgi:hypothetical protein